MNFEIMKLSLKLLTILIIISISESNGTILHKLVKRGTKNVKNGKCIAEGKVCTRTYGCCYGLECRRGHCTKGSETSRYCANDDVCYSQDRCMNKVCRICQQSGEICTTGHECCSSKCLTKEKNNELAVFKCHDCEEIGDLCSKNEDCCSSTCDTKIGACTGKPIDKNCLYDEECLSEDQARCRSGVCKKCAAPKEACINDQECCNFNCNSKTKQCEQCQIKNGKCTENNQCCDSNCHNGICQCNLATGTKCTENKHCCSLLCRDGNCTCAQYQEKCKRHEECCDTGGVCIEDGTCCKPNGWKCKINTECCSTGCWNGICGCNKVNVRCTKNEQCCSKNCFDGSCQCTIEDGPGSKKPCKFDYDCCGGSVCINELCVYVNAACKQGGRQCERNEDCCGKKCASSGYCTCTKSVDDSNSAETKKESSCKSNGECCSGNCVKKICQCRGGGLSCFSDIDCCTQMCGKDGTCTCSKENEHCSQDSECCAENCFFGRCLTYKPKKG